MPVKAVLFAALAVVASAPAAWAQTQAPPPPAAAPEAASADQAAQLADFLAQDSASAVAEPALKVYGFADFNATRWLNLTDQWKNQFPEKLAFYVGRLNVYMEGNIAPDWKSRIEVRFMFI